MDADGPFIHPAVPFSAMENKVHTLERRFGRPPTRGIKGAPSRTPPTPTKRFVELLVEPCVSVCNCVPERHCSGISYCATARELILRLPTTCFLLKPAEQLPNTNIVPGSYSTCVPHPP